MEITIGNSTQVRAILSFENSIIAMNKMSMSGIDVTLQNHFDKIARHTITKMKVHGIRGNLLT